VINFSKFFKFQISNVYPACSFFTNLDLLCIDNARVIYRKIRFFSAPRSTGWEPLLYSLQQDEVRADEKYLAVPDRAWSLKLLSPYLNTQIFLIALNIHFTFSSFVVPFHTKELQCYLPSLRALKAPSVYPHSNAYSSSRTLYSVPSAQLCSPILTPTLSMNFSLY